MKGEWLKASSMTSQCLSWVQIWLHVCKKVASDLRIGGGLPKFPPLLTTSCHNLA